MNEEVKKPRGRPCLGAVPMSSAERKRRSRSLQVTRATQDHHARLPRALSVEIDASLHQRFRQFCQQNQLTQAQGLELLISRIDQ
jgi:hypothetical protein